MSGTVLVVSAHPDDELLGAPAALLTLAGWGWRVVNLALGLGRAADAERRRAELTEACERAGFECAMDTGSGRADAGTGLVGEAELARIIEAHCLAVGASVIVAPTPHDRHPAHEAVGRAALRAVATSNAAPRLWLYAIWGELPAPTLMVPFDDGLQERALTALACHGGELARNDYRRLLTGRARWAAVVGAELVFGFGRPGASDEGAELLMEVGLVDRRWRLGTPRHLKRDGELGPLVGADIGWWLRRPSVTRRLGRPGQ